MIYSSKTFRSVLPRDDTTKNNRNERRIYLRRMYGKISPNRRWTVKIMHFFLKLYPLQAMLRKFITPDIAISWRSHLDMNIFFFSSKLCLYAPAIKVFNSFFALRIFVILGWHSNFKTYLDIGITGVFAIPIIISEECDRENALRRINVLLITL